MDLSDISGIGSAVLNYMGTQDTNRQQEHNAEVNNAWNAQQYATRYQTQVKDLEAAGLNPMLAYSQSPGSAPTAQQVQYQNPVASATQAYNQTTGTSAQASSHLATAFKATEEVQQVRKAVEKISEEIKNIPKEGDRLTELAKNLAEQNSLLKQQGKSEVQRTRQLDEIVKGLKMENAILKEDLDAIRKTGGVGRIAREIAPASDIANDWVKTLNPLNWFKGSSTTTHEYDSRGRRTRSYTER